MFDVTGKTALATGANTGLGQGIALALAKAGEDIALIGRSDPSTTLDQIAKAGVNSYYIHADLSDANAAQDIVAEVVPHLGRADILVNMQAQSNEIPLLISLPMTGTW